VGDEPDGANEEGREEEAHGSHGGKMTAPGAGCQSRAIPGDPDTSVLQVCADILAGWRDQ